MSKHPLPHQLVFSRVGLGIPELAVLDEYGAKDGVRNAPGMNQNSPDGHPSGGGPTPAELRAAKIQQFDQSTFYQEMMTERRAILEHKWIESEKAGHDIGMERALISWSMHHRSDWIRHRNTRARSSA